VPPKIIDEDLAADAYVEDPGNLSDSIMLYPQQVFDAMASATTDDLVAHLATADGDVIEDVDVRDLEIEKTATSGRFLVRGKGAAHNSALAAGVVVTGGALIAAAMHLRHKRQARR
jgi:hypothetical protein